MKKSMENRNIFIFILMFFSVSSCDPDGSKSEPNTVQHILITGYCDNAMEPFLSRDGNYLFFNNNSPEEEEKEEEGTEKDIFYAVRISDTVFQYQGPLSAVNSALVDGTPTMDISNNFYCISLSLYDSPTQSNTVFSGSWTGSTVENYALQTLSFVPDWPLVYFDVEVNSDGSQLYLSIGAFAVGQSVPLASDIYFAEKSGSDFILSEDNSIIMANINTSGKLEYAPALSSSSLLMYFTRFDPANEEYPAIYRSSRPDTDEPFGPPEKISCISNFAEGPAFSADEKYIYFHMKNPSGTLFEIYRIPVE